MFELKVPELKAIDEEITTLNKHYGLAMNSLNRLPNLYTLKIITSAIKDLQVRLKGIKTEDEFEKIAIKNHQKNLEAEYIYLEYFTSAKETTIDEVFDSVLGKEAIKLLKEKAKTFDYKEYWEYYLTYEEFNYKSIPTDDEGLRDTFREMLQELKKDVLLYGQEHFNFPKDYKVDVVLGQPYSQSSHFHPTNRRMEISPNTFFVFKENEEVKINVCAVIDVIFHELIGHGRHEVHSREMPSALQDNSINVANPTLHVHAEGVAQSTRADALNFMRLHKEKYSIEDIYIEQIERSAVTFNWTMNIIYQYLQLKQIEEPKLDIDNEFKEITQNQGLLLLYKAEKIGILGCIRNAVYPLGYHYITKLKEDLKKELGERAFAENHARVNQLLTTGIWHHEVLPEFVRYVLKKEGILQKE